MRTLTAEQFNRALAFLKNRHKVTLSHATPEGEPRVSVDGQTLQRGDVIRMAETEGWSDQWKLTPSRGET
jgi:hypothetical protein